MKILLLLALVCSGCQTIVKDKEEIKHVVSDVIDEETTAIEVKQHKKEMVVKPPFALPKEESKPQVISDEEKE